jgi:hypothetical protein
MGSTAGCGWVGYPMAHEHMIILYFILNNFIKIIYHLEIFGSWMRIADVLVPDN